MVVLSLGSTGYLIYKEVLVHKYIPKMVQNLDSTDIISLFDSPIARSIMLSTQPPHGYCPA